MLTDRGLPDRGAARPAARGIRAAALALAGWLGLAGPAAAVQVTCGAGSGLAGQTVEISVGTGDVTGLGITSFQFEIVYNQNVVTAVGVSESGTTAGAAGWNNATFGVTGGKVTVSDAGATTLSGSGAMIKVQFLLNPALISGSSTTLSMSSAAFVFNEGSPLDTTTNGSITVTPTPVITVSPNSGEVIRAQTLQFAVSGSVTNPVSWFTTDAGVATIGGTGLLTGVAPGTVKVFAVDNAGRRDTTDGVVQIRGMGLTAGSGSVVQGQSVSVPLTVTTLDGLGIRAGQVSLSFNANLLTATGIATPPGTLLDGYGPTAFGATGGTCTFDFVGSNDLSGAGVLCYVVFQATSQTSGGSSLSVTQALFNENLPAKTTNGTVSVTALPSITVSPENVTLLAGQTRQFTLGGSPTPPVTWSTLDPAVASINATGLLTALAGGVTKVRAVDNVGAADENTSVTVHDFQASLPTVVAPPGATVRVPIGSDRSLCGLDIRSLQYTLTHHATHIVSVTARPWGLVSVWGPDGVAQNPSPGTLRVAAAGSDPLCKSPELEIQVLEFVLSPSVPVGTNLPLTLSGVIFNEGRPSALVVNGTLQVRTTSVDVPDATGVAFSLRGAEPNPARGGTRFRWTIPARDPAEERMRLAVYGLDGRLLRTLADGPAFAGEHTADWDGRDADGRAVTAGVYFYRLTLGSRSITRKLAVLSASAGAR